MVGIIKSKCYQTEGPYHTSHQGCFGTERECESERVQKHTCGTHASGIGRKPLFFRFWFRFHHAGPTFNQRLTEERNAGKRDRRLAVPLRNDGNRKRNKNYVLELECRCVLRIPEYFFSVLEYFKKR